MGIAFRTGTKNVLLLITQSEKNPDVEIAESNAWYKIVLGPLMVFNSMTDSLMKVDCMGE